MLEPRALTPSDATSYLALRRQMLVDAPWAFLGAPGDDFASTPEAIAERLSKPENAILAIADESNPARLVAAAGIIRQQRLKTRHRAGIWGVFCDPAFRGRGYGRATVLAAIDTARTWPGVEVVSLCVSARATAAIKLYESLGFKQWGFEPDAVRVDGRSYDDVHMQLAL